MKKFKKIDIQSWNRKAQFDFFREFEQPFFNICTQVEISSVYQECKNHGQPIFLSLLYLLNRSLDLVREFRLRIHENEVLEFQEIHIGATILQDDNTFLFCTIKDHPEYETFIKNAQHALEAQKSANVFQPHDALNMIFVSSLPWISFTGFKHARNNGQLDSIPKFVFGKFTAEKDQLILPISIEVHHALADGYHVGKLLETFQDQLNTFKI